MNAIVHIHGRDIGRLQYCDQSVLTLPMIDDLHERTANTSMNQFLRNKEMFVEGVDYFDLPHSEWKHLLVTSIRRDQKAKKDSLVAAERCNQTDENEPLNVPERCNQTHLQTEENNDWENLEFPFPSSSPPAQTCATEMAPPEEAKVTSAQPRHKQQKLPIMVQKKERGGHRGNMYFLTASGYAMLVKVFNDPRSWEVQRELVNFYFGRGKRQRSRKAA